MADTITDGAADAELASSLADDATLRDPLADHGANNSTAQSIRDFDAQQSREQREEEIRRVVTPIFHTVARAIGISDVPALLHLFNGVCGGAFKVDPDTGMALIQVGGTWKPVPEGLPIHPAVTAQLRSEGARLRANDPLLALRDELAELRAKIPEAQSHVQKHRGANHAVAAHSRLYRRIHQVENEIKSLEKQRSDAQPKFVDPTIHQRTKEIDAEIAQLKSQANSRTGRLPDHVLTKVGRLFREKQQLEKQM